MVLLITELVLKISFPEISIIEILSILVYSVVVKFKTSFRVARDAPDTDFVRYRAGRISG